MAEYRLGGAEDGWNGLLEVHPGSNSLHHGHLYSVHSRHPPLSRQRPGPVNLCQASQRIGYGNGVRMVYRWCTHGVHSHLQANCLGGDCDPKARTFRGTET
jgi:hypothetical protein